MFDAHQSLDGYFKQIGGRTYIDGYPMLIIKLDDLKNGIVIEVGAGVGNDASSLLSELGVNPSNLFLFETDAWMHMQLVKRLGEIFGRSGVGHIFLGGVLENKFIGGKASFIYANNVLHCLGFDAPREVDAKRNYMLAVTGMIFGWYSQDEFSKWEEITFRKPIDKIKKVVEESYRLLNYGGIFFGRTLSDKIDERRLEELVTKCIKTEEERFAIETAKALQDGRLVGVSEKELGKFCRDAGFNAYLAIEKEPELKPVTDFYFRAEK